MQRSKLRSTGYWLQHLRGVVGQARALAAVSKALDRCRDDWDEVQWSGLRPDPDTRSALESVHDMRWAPPIEMFHLELPEDDYTTIAGFIMGRLGRLARPAVRARFPAGDPRDEDTP